jgi:DNA topoisomerase-1
MASAVFDATAVDIEAGETRFRANGQILKFDGFIRVYTEGRDDAQPAAGDEEEGEGQLPVLAEGDTLKLLEILPEQHFTQPPPRFTQATLIKELEENGIGRPSTYASIVGTILNKEYVVEDEQRRLKPTELGFLVTDLLVEAFPDVLNVEFTAGMENDLDRIEEGQEHWVSTMRRFWEPFARDLEKAHVEMRDVKREERPTDLVCEKCGKPMIIKWGRRGEFLACSGYPECKTTMNFTRDDDGTIRPAQPETTDEICEKCGRPMQVRFGRYGKFLGCSGYPECKNMQPLHKPVPTGVKCLGCGQGELMERRSRRGKLFYSCNRYPECQFVAWDRPIPEPCPKCAAPFVTEKVTKRYGTIRRCVREECGWQTQIAGEDGAEVAPLPERRAAAKMRPRRSAPAGKTTDGKAAGKGATGKVTAAKNTDGKATAGKTGAGKATAGDAPRRSAARGRASSR